MVVDNAAATVFVMVILYAFVPASLLLGQWGHVISFVCLLSLSLHYIFWIACKSYGSLLTFYDNYHIISTMLVGYKDSVNGKII
jgi:hypothetical protein